MNDISKDYFNWLCKLIDYRGKVKIYKKTLALLHEQDYCSRIIACIKKNSGGAR